MGYTKRAVEEQVSVKMRFNVINHDDNTNVTYEVMHILRVPTVAEREGYQREIARVKGRKVIANSGEANWHLWLKCIISVEGYDDLPKTGDWKQYFSSGVERIHVDEAISQMLQSFESEETDVEKKFVQSSVQ